MLKTEIVKLIEGDVFDDKETLAQYSHDASIFELRPMLVVAPKTREDVKVLVKYVSEREGVSLTVRGGGSDMSGGPLSESIVVDASKYLNKILEVRRAGKDEQKGAYAVVEPGVFYRDFDSQTRRMDLFLPSYPASKDLCTVGGMVANNSGGEKTLAYGKTENYILALKVVLSDGNEYEIRPLTKAELDMKMKLDSFEGQFYREMFKLVSENNEAIKAARPDVKKNSAGYYLWNVYDEKNQIFDLTKLMVGSQGTLGIITEIKFSLVKVQPNSGLVVGFLRDLSHLGEMVVDLVNLGPVSVESYDDKTLRLALYFFRDLLKVIKPKNAFKLFIHLLPELIRMLFKGLPRLVVMVEFEGSDRAEIEKKMGQTAGVFKKFKTRAHIVETKDEEEEYWAVRRESFSLLRNKIKDKHTAPFIDDFAVKPEVLPEFLPKLNAILNQYKIAYTIAGHPGSGNFHIIPLMNLEDEDQRVIIPRLSDQVYNLVLQYKGTITAEHNDGLIRTPYLEKMYGKNAVVLFEKTKRIFDPRNIFNPGKKVWGNLAYALSHIRRSW